MSALSQGPQVGKGTSKDSIFNNLAIINVIVKSNIYQQASSGDRVIEKVEAHRSASCDFTRDRRRVCTD